MPLQIQEDIIIGKSCKIKIVFYLTHKYSNYLCYNNKVPIWHEMDKVG